MMHAVGAQGTWNVGLRWYWHATGLLILVLLPSQAWHA